MAGDRTSQTAHRPPVSGFFRVVAFGAAIVAAGAARAETRILAFGDSNTWGWIATAQGFPTTRLSDEARWPGVLETALGSGTRIVVDGLVGRTTDIDGQDVGPVAGTAFNGAAALPSAIARNLPLDLVIIFLGTNDLQERYGRSAEAVAEGAMRLAGRVRAADHLVFTGYPAPRVFVVAPPAYGRTAKTPLRTLFAGGEAPSRDLARAFREAGQRHGVEVFESGTVADLADSPDGIHLSPPDHQALGLSLAKAVRRLLALPASKPG